MRRTLPLAAVLAATPAHADEPLPAPLPTPRLDADADADVATPARPRRPTGRFELGAGYAPDEGLILHAGVVQDDLFGTGQRLALTTELSALGHRFHLGHEVADLLGSGLDLRTELYATRRQRPGFAREAHGGALTVGRRLDRATRVYVRYRAERVGVALDDPDAAAAAAALARGLPAARTGDGRLAALGAGIAHDTRDDRLLPRAGTRLELFAERAAPALGSEVSLLRLAAAADHARPLGPFTLRLQARGAHVRSLDGLPVPLAERLHHGGHRDLRGYPLDALGLVVRDGHRVAAGADSRLDGRVELELPVWRAAGLSIAAFADLGVRHNADPGWGPTGASLHPAVGASIIWRSPIGPLRFDWAIPLDGRDRRPAFLFGLGGDF